MAFDLNFVDRGEEAVSTIRYAPATDGVEVRRSRRLVVSSIHTVGNYDYGIFWYFHLDGSIRLEPRLTQPAWSTP